MSFVSRFRKITVSVLALAMVAGSASMVMAHGHGNGHGHGPGDAHQRFHDITGFSDVDESSTWAMPYIMQMYLQGLIKGEGHGRFNPKGSVSEAEAVTFAVRQKYGSDKDALVEAASIVNPDGKTAIDEYEAYLQDNTNWNIKAVAHSAAWALPYEVVAVHDGLLNGDDPYQPNKSGDRAWATELLVKEAIATGDLPADAINHADQSVLSRFTDRNSIHNGEAAYIAAAVGAGLIDGYPDHTFRPNAAISRAEFVVLLARLGESGPTGDVVKGTVDSVDTTNGSITIDTNKDSVATKTYTVDDDALIYVKIGDKFVNNGTLSLNDVQPGDAVELHLDSDGQVALVYDSYETQSVDGTISDVQIPTNSSDPYEFTLKTGNSQVDFTVAPYASIYLLGEPSDMAALQAGDTATVQYHGNEAVVIRVQPGSGSSGDNGSGSENVTLNGSVVQVLSSNLFTMKVTSTTDSATVTRIYTVTVNDDTRFVGAFGMDDLNAGDAVTVEGEASGYDLVADTVTLSDSGQGNQVSISGTVATIVDDSHFTLTDLVTKDGSTDVVIYNVTVNDNTTFDGLTGVADLEQGETVQLDGTLSGNDITATKITVDNGGTELRQVDITGIVRTKDNNHFTMDVTVDVPGGSIAVTYTVATNADTTFQGADSVSDIQKGSKVEVKGLADNTNVTATSVAVLSGGTQD